MKNYIYKCGKLISYSDVSILARPIHTLIVGCEPALVITGEDDIDMQMGLSEPVQAAVAEAVKMIDSLVERLLTATPAT